MANIQDIYGFNRVASVANILLAVYGNDVVNVDTGLGYSLNIISPDLATMEGFVDYAFLQTYTNPPLSFNGTAWGVTNVGRAPSAKAQKQVGSQLYLGYIKLGDPQMLTGAGLWPSRVAYCDLPTKTQLTWGLEWGTNLTATAGSKVVSVGNSIQDFVNTNIKVGDPFYITSGLGYEFRSFVKTIDSRYQITLQDVVPASINGNGQFWVGSNWFDVATDDGDDITTLGENSTKVLIFKQLSLWVYNKVSLIKVRGAPGTQAKRSVVNIGKFTFYFYGSNAQDQKSGVYLFDGFQSTQISKGVQKYIDAMDPNNYPNVVAWAEGSRLRMFLGDLTNIDQDVSISNAVFTFDTDGNQVSVDNMTDLMTATGTFLETNSEKTFLGNSNAEVFQTPLGNKYDTDPIPWSFETGPRYPDGTGVINYFTRVQIISTHAVGLQVYYKLLGTPFDNDDMWHPLGDIKHPLQEFMFNTAHRTARGFNIKVLDINGNLNDQRIDKITVWYVPKSTRSET